MKPDRRTSLPLLLLIATALVAALLPGAAAAANPEWKNVEGVPGSLGTIAGRAPGMTQGPEGNTWFAGTNGSGSGLLGFVGPTAPFTVWAPSQFPSGPVSPQAKALENLPLRDITAGPDGNLWATNTSASVVLRVTPQGAITSFPLTRSFEVNAPLQEPQEIVTGPDGALWVTANAFGGAIGRIAPDGTFTAFPLQTGAAQGARGIAVGPDGALWFTEPGAGAIGRITTAGAITSFKLAAPGAEPNEITLGPDGNLWFTEGRGTKIGRVTPQGKITEFAAESAGPIVSGPEGDLWFGSANGIGSITTDGVRGVTNCLYLTPQCGLTVEALTVGADGKIHFSGAPPTQRDLTPFKGYVGVFAIPPTAATVAGGKAKAKGARFSLVSVTCGGGAAGQGCQGTIGLEAKGTRIGSRKFTVLSGETRSVAVRLTNGGLKAFGRKQGLSGGATVRIPGAQAVTAKVTLTRPPGLH